MPAFTLSPGFTGTLRMLPSDWILSSWPSHAAPREKRGQRADLVDHRGESVVRGDVHLSKNAAVAYAPCNIRINCVLRGDIDTPMSPTVADEDARMLMEFTPLGRRAEPEELAPMFVFLASDESRFVAAANFMNDGGKSAL